MEFTGFLFYILLSFMYESSLYLASGTFINVMDLLMHPLPD